MLVTSASFSQESYFSQKHHFGIRTGVHYSFDGNPVYQSKRFFQDNHQNFPVATTLNYGVNYSKRYNILSSWGVSLSINRFQKLVSIEELYRGRILERSFLDVRGNHKSVIFKRKRHLLEINKEISLRFGNENFLGAFGIIGYITPDDPIYETLPLTRTIADVGIALGCKYQFAITQSLYFQSEINYTFYPFTYYNKHHIYSFDRGTTRNLLIGNIGFVLGIGDVDLSENIVDNSYHKRRNQLFIQRSLFSFFRNEPTIQKRNMNTGFGSNLSQSFGFGFKRKLSEKNHISLIIEDYEFRNSIPDNELVNGSTKGRTFLGTQVSYLRSLKNIKRSDLLGGLGIYYRYGLEYFAGDKAINVEDNRFSKKELRDIGLSLHTTFYKVVHKHINIQSSLNYTYFVHTKDTVGKKYFWDKKPTQNMISLSLGIGFDFGK